MFQKLIIFIISIFDYFYQKKIIKFLHNNKKNNFEIFVDVGAHKGETINLFLNNFNIKKIISFEPSPITYEFLKKQITQLKLNFKKTEIIIENFALGDEQKESVIKHMSESSSSTINHIDQNSSYFKKKFKILNFFGKKKLYKSLDIKIIKLSKYLSQNRIQKIDFLKIDTEGYEYEVIKGLEDHIKNVKMIMFEHHYDNMIKKNYTFSDIHLFFKKNFFKQAFKIKMPFRKSFEYIYINEK